MRPADADGEKQGARERIDVVAKRAIDSGHTREEAYKIGRRAAIQHEHDQGRRDPTRNRR